MKQVIINGKAYSYTEEQTILRLLHGIAIAIPALCNDDRFAPASVCRSCLEKNSNPPQPSCRTFLAADGNRNAHAVRVEKIGA